jgi:hypothetical protein
MIKCCPGERIEELHKIPRIREVSMKRTGKTNRLKAALKRKNVRKNLRKSKGERKYPS